MGKFLFLLLLNLSPLAAQEIPRATALPSNPFFVKQTWFIGGAGSWDFLTVDPGAQRLYIAHGNAVQVVDIASGSLVAQIGGFREVHAIALDDTGTYGYVSDGQADTVTVFDRRGLNVETVIPVQCSPRSIAFEPRSRLVFAICGANTSPQAGAGPARRGQPPHVSEEQEQSNSVGVSHIVAIDAEKRAIAADISVAGDFRFAQADNVGSVWVSVGEAHRTWTENGRVVREVFPQRVARLDAQGVAAQVLQQAQPTDKPLMIDWSRDINPSPLVHFVPLRSGCENPQGLAVDNTHQRLFLACGNQRFVVVNSMSGDVVASLTTGPGGEAIGYDQDRNTLFVANGAGYGSLTIISQGANTDSYEVIQNLPTRERARTLAVDQSTGLVYLVTDFQGVDLTTPGTIGTLRTVPISGSFHVLVVGH